MKGSSISSFKKKEEELHDIKQQQSTPAFTVAPQRIDV